MALWGPFAQVTHDSSAVTRRWHALGAISMGDIGDKEVACDGDDMTRRWLIFMSDTGDLSLPSAPLNDQQTPPVMNSQTIWPWKTSLMIPGGAGAARRGPVSHVPYR